MSKKLDKITRLNRVVAMPSRKKDVVVKDKNGEPLKDKNGEVVIEKVQLYNINRLR